MPSIVLELQQMATDSEIGISDLLRKALLVARKLGVKEFEEWINKELNGYETGADGPKYRFVKGQVKAWNPYYGWVPTVAANAEAAQELEALSERFIGQPIASIEDLKRGDTFSVYFPKKAEHQMMKTNGNLRPALIVERSQAINILDAVRNNILRWALQLEERGVLGEAMTFTQEEKKTATTLNVHNYFGHSDNIQIQQDSPGASQSINISGIDIDHVKQLIDVIKKAGDTLNLTPEIKEKFNSDVNTLEAQCASPAPENSIIHTCLRSIRGILNNVVCSVATSEILELISRMLG